MEDLSEKEIRDFQKSIGITVFSRMCLSIHNTMMAVWQILILPFTKFFDVI